MSITAVFLEGLLSFFSPCILPLLPLFLSYFSLEKERSAFWNTLFFVLGIYLTFFLLALSLGGIGQFLADYRSLLAILSGYIIIFLSLHELGIIRVPFLEKGLSLPLKLDLRKMNFLKAFVFGALFSFIYSPCIGPLLGSAMLLALSSGKAWLYLLVYALGLSCPFLLLGIMADRLLVWLNRQKKYLNYALKLAGIILLFTGLALISSGSKELMSYRNEPSLEAGESSSLTNLIFKDTDGENHSFSAYSGQYVFLNFSATWCQYCAEEIENYLSFAAENPEIVCLYVMSPSTSNCQPADLKKYREEHNIDLSVLVDEHNILTYYCLISSYPTLFVLGPDGQFLTYAPGYLSKENFYEVLEYAKSIKD